MLWCSHFVNSLWLMDFWIYGACLLCVGNTLQKFLTECERRVIVGMIGYICDMRTYHLVYMCVYIVANKTCDNTEPCFQSASVRLCVQKVASRPKDKAMGTGRGWAWFPKKQHLMANNHPVFIFLPSPFLFSLECTIPSCLFGNFNGSSGRPGDQNDVWLFIMKEKIVRVAACPTTLSNAGWSLKIVLLSIMVFQLEMIWNFCLMVQVGWEPTKYSVGIWMAFMRIWVGYNGKVQLWNECSESQNVGMATVLYVGYWLATHWKAEVLLCVFYLSACMQLHIHRMREL